MRAEGAHAALLDVHLALQRVPPTSPGAELWRSKAPGAGAAAARAKLTPVLSAGPFGSRPNSPRYFCRATKLTPVLFSRAFLPLRRDPGDDGRGGSAGASARPW